MFKPCLILCFASIVGLLLMSSVASAQIGGPAQNSPLGNIFKNNNATTSNKSSVQHDLKSAEAGLGDADPRVRVEALRKLRNVHEPEADFLLIRAMSDPDTRVRVKAIDILGGRG